MNFRISAPHDFRRTRAVSPHTWISARGAYFLGGKAEYTRVRTCFEYTMRLECAAITNDKRVCARFCVPNTTWKLTTNEFGRGRYVEATATPGQRPPVDIYLGLGGTGGAWRLAPRVGCYPQHYEDTGALRSCDVIGAHTRSAGGNSLGRHAGHGHFGPDARPFLDMSIFTLGCLPCRDGWWASVP